MEWKDGSKIKQLPDGRYSQYAGHAEGKKRVSLMETWELPEGLDSQWAQITLTLCDVFRNADFRAIKSHCKTDTEEGYEQNLF